MKKILVILLAVMMIFGIAGCQQTAGPDKTVSDLLDAMKAWDTAALEEYMGLEDIYGATDMDMSSEEAEMTDALMKALTANLDYTIVNTQEDGDTAIVTADITNVDMSVVMAEYITQVFALYFSGTDMTEEELNTAVFELLVTSIENNQETLVTNTVDIELTKVDGEWVITADDAFYNAVFGGMMTAFEDWE